MKGQKYKDAFDLKDEENYPSLSSSSQRSSFTPDGQNHQDQFDQLITGIFSSKSSPRNPQSNISSVPLINFFQRFENDDDSNTLNYRNSTPSELFTKNKVIAPSSSGSPATYKNK